MEAVCRQVGVAWFRSITAVSLSTVLLPPVAAIFPGRYIIEVPLGTVAGPMTVHVCVLTSRVRETLSDAATTKTLPLGITNTLGYSPTFSRAPVNCVQVFVAGLYISGIS